MGSILKAIKKINNNAAICIDNNGNELVALGTGIGFPNVPYDIFDLSIIQRTFYNVDPRLLSILKEIDIKIINTSEKLLRKYSEQCKISYSNSTLFSLADHINFAISRVEQGIVLKSPLHYEVQHRFENEYNIGLFGIKLIQNELGVVMPKEEASNIALHLINSTEKKEKQIDENEIIISKVFEIISQHFNFNIDKKSINYSRFNSHLSYLLDRLNKKIAIESENIDMFDQIKDQYIDVFYCCQKIADFLYQNYGFKLSDEEIFYLIIHINRLYTREENYKE